MNPSKILRNPECVGRSDLPAVPIPASIPRIVLAILATLTLAFTASSAFADAPSASRSGGYPDYEVGDTATLTITTNPAQPNATVYRFRYKNGLPDGAQPTEIGTTNSSGVFTATGVLTVGTIGSYSSERFAVGDPGGPRSNSLSYDVHAANAPSASRPAPYPTYEVGDLARNIITTSPAQPNQPVYRFRYKNGSPDGDQPTHLGNTDENGRLDLEGTLSVGEIGNYSGERFAVGTEGGPRSTAKSYVVHASNAPTAVRAAPFPNYRVGDLATLNLSTSPAQPNQPVYRYRSKDGLPDGTQPTYIGTTNSNGQLQNDFVLSSADEGSYTGERFAVGTEGGPRSPSLSYQVLPSGTGSNAPSAVRSSPYPNYEVGQTACLAITTDPPQPNAPVYRFRWRDGQPDGAQPTQIGTTDSTGRFEVCAVLTVGEVGDYDDERFAVGDPDGPTSSPLYYSISHSSSAPTAVRPAPYPHFVVGDTASLVITTSPALPNLPVYRYRLKNGLPDGAQPTIIGTTDALGRFEASAVLSESDIGYYSDEQFTVGQPDAPASSPLAYSVQPEGVQAPTVLRSEPFPNYQEGDDDNLVLSTDPVQAHQPVYRFRLKNGFPEGAQPTVVGQTDASGRFESTATWSAGSNGSYTDERYAIGAPDGPTSTPLAFTVLPQGTTLQAPVALRPSPFPNYQVGDTARLVLTTDPVQANQPVFRYRQKDGEPDGAQPTVIGFTNGFGRLEVEAVLPAESVGNYTDERFAVGSPDGLLSNPLAYSIVEGSTSELSFESVTPTTVDADSITVLTLEGDNFDSSVQVFIADTSAAASSGGSDDGGSDDGGTFEGTKDGSARRTKAGGAPSVRVLSVAPDGRSMQVEMDTMGSNAVDALELLVVSNSTSEKAQPVRVVGEGPIVDAWTPSVPVRGNSYVLTLVGANLATATVQPPTGASVRILSRTDARLTGVMTVSSSAPLGPTSMAISANGRTVIRPMRIVDPQGAPASEQNLLAGSEVEAKSLAAGNPAPRLMMQGVELDPNLATAYAMAEQKASARGWCASFYTSWSRAFEVSYELVLFDIDTGEIGEIAAILGIGDQLNIGSYTIAVRLQIAIHFQWIYCSHSGWWPPVICFEVLLEAEVPGGTYTGTYRSCFEIAGGSGPSSGSTDRADLVGGECADVVNYSINQGVGQSTITQTDCCNQQVGADVEGESFGDPFDLEFPDVGETEPDPECSNLDCYDITLEIASVDARFAPGTERLEINYTMNPPDGEFAYGLLEIYADGDDQNPIFQDDTLQMGSNVAYMQEGQVGWDGMGSSGDYITPDGSPYTVKISTSLSPDFDDPCTTSDTFQVEVHSISITPTGSRDLFKPAGATDVNETVTAEVSLKKKDGSAAPTTSAVEIEWSFEDPDDASGRSGVDPNGRAGDDNAPLANGGKRILSAGENSTMWRPAAGYQVTLGAQGQTAVTTTAASGNDAGKTKVQFSASVIAGDNYIVVAKVKSSLGSTPIEARTGTWTIRKQLDFDKGYQMASGTNISSTMQNSRVRHRALTRHAHTDYNWGGNVTNLNNSPEFVAELLDPVDCNVPVPPPNCETPTPAEVMAHNGGDATATAAITAKAQRWHDRNDRNMSTSLDEFINDNNISTHSAVGARFSHPKTDGRPGTGDTQHYPSGIIITTRQGIQVDPDAADWRVVGGSEYREIAWIFRNNNNLTRTARHEVGHASDHHSFGPGDHSTLPNDLMYFSPTRNTFGDTSILRLRGWAP